MYTSDINISSIKPLNIVSLQLFMAVRNRTSTFTFTQRTNQARPLLVDTWRPSKAPAMHAVRVTANLSHSCC